MQNSDSVLFAVSLQSNWRQTAEFFSGIKPLADFPLLYHTWFQNT